jgi:glyoxylase-like metal-dependent hydrolase (beta-lactamase superfamily II)
MQINELGGLKMIVISHPHFYTTWADWSATFNCPVYLSKVDSVWANRKTFPKANLKLLADQTTEILPSVTAIICGGHFEGSLVLHWENLLFVADTLLMVRSAQNPDPAKPGVASYSFMWSIPNWIRRASCKSGERSSRTISGPLLAFSRVATSWRSQARG